MSKRETGTEIDTDDLEDAVAEQLGRVDDAANKILVESVDETPQESTEISDEEKDVLLLYKPKCVNCTHLIPEAATKVYNSCHYSKGNADCPAANTKIVVMIPAEKVSDLLLQATLSNDVIRMSELTARLNKSDPAEVERTLLLYRKKLAASGA